MLGSPVCNKVQVSDTTLIPGCFSCARNHAGAGKSYANVQFGFQFLPEVVNKNNKCHH